MAIYAKTFDDFFYLVKRRKYYILVPWFLFSLLALLIALSLPRSYRSAATLLMEASLPTKLFETTATEYADERVQALFQRVMNTSNILSLIEKHDLYADGRDSFPKQRLVDFFKGNTEIALAVSSFVAKSNSGQAEFAFDIAFTDTEPEAAQAVASALANQLIEQNDKSRTQRATKTADFLLAESDKLNKDLQAIEDKIAYFKEQNSFTSPEQTEGNMAAMDRVESELRDTDAQINSTRDRATFLEAELARAPEPVLPNLGDNGDKDGKAFEKGSLAELQARYVELLSMYSPSHPSVKRLKRQIQLLDPAFTGQPNQGDVASQLIKAKENLAALRKEYSEDHPEVIKLNIQIDRLGQQLKSPMTTADSSRRITTRRTTNPAFLGLEAQLRTSRTDLQSLYQKKEYLKAKLDKLQNSLALAPHVEKEYNDLIRDRDNTKNKYTQIKEKLLDAKLFQTQEQQHQGQNLTIIEEPIVPIEPEKGGRKKIVIGGVALGLLGGLGLALLIEFLDPTVKGYRAIADVTGLMPLIVIPYIETATEYDERLALKEKTKRLWLIGIALLVVTIISTYCYYNIFTIE